MDSPPPMKVPSSRTYVKLVVDKIEYFIDASIHSNKYPPNAREYHKCGQVSRNFMKAILLSFLLAASNLFAADGAFYVNKPVETHLIAQSGATVTNKLVGGSTATIVGTGIVELCPSERTTIYLSGGPTIDADAGSVLSINAFDQEVKNLTNQPCLAVFGAHNISIVLSTGNFSVNYTAQDAESTFAISTPLAMYQMNTGKFLFQISEAKSLVYVLDGMMIVHGDKSRKDTAKKGSKSITGQIDTEVATTTRPINPQESSTIATMQTRTNASAAIQFIVIDGRVRGVRMSP